MPLTRINDPDYVADWLRGAQDCQKGDYKEGQNEAYNRGNAAQYESEQVKTHRSMTNER